MRIHASINRMVNKEDSAIKAYASVTMDGMFAVHGLRVIETEKGRFVNMPSTSYTDKDGNKRSAVDIIAENVYFGKPCGLMDQLASSTGGLVFMDFRDPAAPEVRRLNAALPGYALCIVDSGADHADLTAQYAAIPRDLKAVCRLFDAEVLRQVDEDAFYRRLPEVRRLAGDRAVLRAIHVFDENRRVLAQVRALESGDVPGFLSLINASGASSWEYLQNIAPAGAAEHQALAVTLALCRRMLRGRGAVRVHGGGFAGTALCIVPEEKLSAFCRELETHLAPDCCHRLQIR